MLAPKRKLDEINADLLKAGQDLIFCQQDSAKARTAETNALNTVNRLQKEFDQALLDFRDAAPNGTDWKLEKCKVRGIAA